jgi:hypothetical protein
VAAYERPADPPVQRSCNRISLLREGVTVIHLHQHATDRRGPCILYSRLAFSLRPPLPRTASSAEGKQQEQPGITFSFHIVCDQVVPQFKFPARSRMD